ncbi:MAG: hypothetical protein QNK37_09295 [Acidobacteriota bacterium]|nr:hypothetical protein [Acidobacteriota bacterium]
MAEGLKFKPLHPVATILNHLRLIGVVTVLGTVILGTFILLKVRPEFMSEAGVEVELRQGRVLFWDQEKQFGSRTQYTDFVNTQVNYIVSFENVMEALSRVDLSQTAFVPGEDPQSTYFRFIPMMEVKAVRNTNLISVAVKDSQPKGLALFANALVDTYMDRVREHEMAKNDSRIQHLEAELKRKREELADRNELMTEYSLELGTLNLSRETNPHDESLTYLRDELNQAVVNRVKAENAYKGLAEKVRKERDLNLDPLVEELILQDLSAIEMRNRVLANREELNRQSGSMTRNHPNRQRLEEEVQRSQDYLDNIQEELRQKAEGILEGKQLLEQERALIENRSAYDNAVKNETEMRTLYEAEMADLKKITPIFLTASQVSDEIENDKARIAQIESRMEELAIEAREPLRFRIQSRARDPLFPTRDRRKLFLLVAVFFSLALGLAAAFALDLFEPSVIDARHMAEVIGARPTGILFKDNKRDYARLMRDHPETFHADQFRRMMPRIFGAENSEAKIFTVVALANGHGTTAVALNCAAHLERTGRGACLLQLPATDSDLPHHLQGWNLDREEVTVGLDSNHEIQLVRQFSNRGLSCYYPEDARGKFELSNPELLQSLLKQLSERRGALLIDAPPLFQNSEAELLCRLADTVILVVNGPKIAAGALSRGMNLLEELGVKQCAVIANGLPVLPGGYYTRAKAAFEGRDLKYPLLHDITAATRRALDPQNRKW